MRDWLVDMPEWEDLRLNQAEASDGWLTQDALWLASKTVCDRLRAHLLSQGVDSLPDRNTAVFDVLQEHGIAGSLTSRSRWQGDLAGRCHKRHGVDPALRLPAHASENQGLAA